jgi:hypothetical protein
VQASAKPVESVLKPATVVPTASGQERRSVKSCVGCGYELPTVATFCPKCSAKQPDAAAITQNQPVVAATSTVALIHCPICQKLMAQTADNCPECGGSNNWIDPRIAQIVNAINTGNLEISGKRPSGEEYTFFYAKTRVWGINPVGFAPTLCALIGGGMISASGAAPGAILKLRVPTMVALRGTRITINIILVSRSLLKRSMHSENTNQNTKAIVTSEVVVVKMLYHPKDFGKVMRHFCDGELL